MRELITRRETLQRLGALSLSVSALPEQERRKPMQGTIQTVLGPIPAEKFGLALIHEHILCDFIGADKTGRERWNVAEVVKAIKPNLLEVKKRGVTGFVDCTPAYIGRDPRILKQLAQETGLHIITNTGYYGGAGDKFLPKHAFTESPEQLADRWISEWEKGIEETGVKPGHIKIGVDEVAGNPPELSDVDAKLATAAARASKRTGLTVTCHTGGGPAGFQAAERFVKAGGDPAKFIVAHSDGHGTEINKEVAELGAWVSLDGHGYRKLEEHLATLRPLLEKHADRTLISMDSGWYNAGEPSGGKIRDYNYLMDVFLPALKKEGVTDALIRKLTVENPARAFARVG